MDDFEEYMYKSNKVNAIVENAKTINEILEAISSSTELDLNQDFEHFCFSIKILRPELFFDFLIELENNNKTDLIMSNIEFIGINNFFKLADISKNPEIIEFVYDNFERLINSEERVDLDSIKSIIIKGKDREEVKRSIPIIIKTISVYSRVELIELIVSNPELGNIEDYLEDLLYVDEKTKLSCMDDILSELEQIDNLDRTKLLEAIKNNINNLLNSFDKNSSFRLKMFLEEIKEIEASLPTDSEKLLEDTNMAIAGCLKEVLKKHEYKLELISMFRQFNIEDSVFKEIQDDIINSLSGKDLIIYIQSAKENEGFNRNWDGSELTRQLFKHDEEIANDKILQSMIAKLIDELCKHEKVGIEDIEYGGSGFFNFNIKIGDYILKLGQDGRETDYIPNDKRIIKPLLRQQTNIGNKKDVPTTFVEIQNVVDTSWYDELDKDEIREQLYIIYKELRDRGKVWTDIKPQNVGRLLKPNKENFKIEVLNENGEIEKKELQSSNYAVSFTGDMPNEILDTGELVVIDTDYIYKADDKYKYPVPKESYFDEFEERYREEKSKIDTAGIKDIIKEGKYKPSSIGRIRNLFKERVERQK